MDTETQTLHVQLDRLTRSLSRYTMLRTEAQRYELSAWERYFHAQEQQLSAKINRLTRQLVAPVPKQVDAAPPSSARLRELILDATPVRTETLEAAVPPSALRPAPARPLPNARPSA